MYCTGSQGLRAAVAPWSHGRIATRGHYVLTDTFNLMMSMHFCTHRVTNPPARLASHRIKRRALPKPRTFGAKMTIASDSPLAKDFQS